MGAPTRNTRQIWGEPPVVESEALKDAIADLQADLQALVQDLRRGPVATLREQIEAFLSELRREFLRPHRRLSVHAKNADGRDGAREALGFELAALADRFRAVVLSRSSRIQHQTWTPVGIANALHEAIEGLPRLVMAPYEARTLFGDPSDGVLLRIRRRSLRLDSWIRKRLGASPHERGVELRQLGRYHFEGRVMLQIEGLAALFVQCEIQLAGRSRQLMEAVAQGFEALVSHVEQDDFPDMLSGLRIQLEDEFVSVERDVNQILDDSVHRAEMIFGEALRTLKDELVVIGTVDLPSRRRRSAGPVAEAQRSLADLSSRLDAVVGHIAASYNLLALHLEFVGFRARLLNTIDGVLAELRADVRGRSRVQLERVRSAVDDVLQSLETRDEATDDEAIRARVAPLEHTVDEAAGITRQLLDQLSAEASVAPMLEALNREAQGLTARYLVPDARLPRAEWKLPAVGGLAEVDFAQVVTNYVQREVAPELLTIANKSMNQVLPIIDTFQDLQRVVSFNAESIDDRLTAPSASAGAEQQLAEIMQATLRRSRDALTERLSEGAHWDEDLVADIRRTVVAKLDQLRRRLGEGDITRARAVGRAEPKLQWIGRWNLIREGLRSYRGRAARWLLNVIGERRLAALREFLGLPKDEPPVLPDPRAWAPPRREVDLPVFYSRLFGPQARWAGDVINVPESDVRRARDTLSTAGSGPKAVAMIGADAASRGALVGAVLRGGKPSRRLAFTQPTSVEQLRAQLGELGPGSVIQLSGLGWLVSARPGGFEPLRHLLDVIVKEDRRAGWLLEVDTYVWAFATAVSPISDVFATQIRLSPLSPRELEQAILARHQLSGYDLKFESSEYGDSRANERSIAQERFFQALHAASGGLLQVALTMWLHSIGRVHEERSLVVVSKEPESCVSALRRLPESTLLVLYVVVRQGWAEPGALAFSLQIEMTVAEARLVSLVGLGLLERSAREVFTLRRHVRGAVLVLLRERGWLD